MKLLTWLTNLSLGFQLKTAQLLQSYYYKLNLEQQWKIRPVFQMHLPSPSIVARHFNKAFRMLVSATVKSTSKFMSPWDFRQRAHGMHHHSKYFTKYNV
jgi:hypothetical protein